MLCHKKIPFCLTYIVGRAYSCVCESVWWCEWVKIIVFIWDHSGSQLLRVWKTSVIVYGLRLFVKGAKVWCDLHKSESKWSVNPESVHAHLHVCMSAVCIIAQGLGGCRLASQPDRCALAWTWSAGTQTGLPPSISAMDPWPKGSGHQNSLSA